MVRLREWERGSRVAGEDEGKEFGLRVRKGRRREGVEQERKRKEGEGKTKGIRGAGD